MSRKILRRLKFDNDTIHRVMALVRAHDDRPPLQGRSVRRAIYRNGTEQYPELFEVKRADILAQSSFLQQENCCMSTGMSICISRLWKKSNVCP